MQLTKRPVLDASRTSSKDEGPSKIDSFRAACLSVSNAILQFPLLFEIQQRCFQQPGILRHEVEQELLSQDPAEEFTVLDYGCGTGTYAGIFSPRNYVGIDANQPMLDRASQQHKEHTFIQATDLTGIHDVISKVSHVLMVGVVHHLPDEACLSILSSLPSARPLKILTIDTLKCTSGPGKLIQLFERGEHLRTEEDHKKLLNKAAVETGYKKVPYGKWFELAIFRGVIGK